MNVQITFSYTPNLANGVRQPIVSGNALFHSPITRYNCIGHLATRQKPRTRNKLCININPKGLFIYKWSFTGIFKGSFTDNGTIDDSQSASEYQVKTHA